MGEQGGDPLKERLQVLGEALRQQVRQLLQESGDQVLDQIRVRQVLGGMRGVRALVCVTSSLDPETGVRYRGIPVAEVSARLPRPSAEDEAYVEGLFWLLLTGSIPTEEEVNWLRRTLSERSHVPYQVYEVLDRLPAETHPMAAFSMGILAMRRESVMREALQKGVSKDKLWEYAYEDALNLLAKIPYIAAHIYRRFYRDGKYIDPDPSLDWGANFAHMLGNDDPAFYNLMRLYLILHADHGGGNVSVHAARLVGSAWSDPYLAYSAGMNGLAGPLHGLANQQVVQFILEMQKALGSMLPTREQIAEYVRDMLKKGRVIPGFGHAVLRKTDPRFLAQKAFAEKHCPDDEFVQVVWRLYEIVPPILQATGKVKNPWPNVDLHSGALLRHYGIVEYTFYTVFFGVARALGILAQLVWDRLLGLPIERPVAVPLQDLFTLLAEEAQPSEESRQVV